MNIFYTLSNQSQSNNQNKALCKVKLKNTDIYNYIYFFCN